MKIRSNAKVRNEIASAPTYWKKTEHAIICAHNILTQNGLSFDDSALAHDWDLPSANTLAFKLKDDKGEPVTNSVLVFNWYWMNSGSKVEVVMYLS